MAREKRRSSNFCVQAHSSVIRSSTSCSYWNKCCTTGMVMVLYCRHVNPGEPAVFVKKTRDLYFLQCYAVSLGIFNAFVAVRTAASYSFHLSVVLLAIFALYTYRDIWPLVSYALVPADRVEGNILWVKVALVTFAGCILPIFEPYPYIPVDPAVGVFFHTRKYYCLTILIRILPLRST